MTKALPCINAQQTVAKKSRNINSPNYDLSLLDLSIEAKIPRIILTSLTSGLARLNKRLNLVITKPG
jgi:hypothetical protein